MADEPSAGYEQVPSPVTDEDHATVARADQPFAPPSFFDALKSSFRRPRFERGRPASGTVEEASRVNYIDVREKKIGTVLAILQVATGFIFYFEDRQVVIKASKTLSAAKAHAQTLSLHHTAPLSLGINVFFGLAIGAALLTRRRALIAILIMLGGFAMTQYANVLVGLIYLAVGIWLVIRSMRRPAPAAERLAPAGGRPRDQRVKNPKPPPQRKSPSASNRYTPPRKPSRPAPSTTTTESPEPRTRLSAWLKR